MVAIDTESMNGKKMPAFGIAEKRLDSLSWPIFHKTPNKSKLMIEDRVLFYIGGREYLKQHFIVSSTIKSIAIIKNKKSEVDQSLFAGTAENEIKFEKINNFDNPVLIASLLSKLSFVPRNTSKYGVVLQGGCIKMPKGDFEFII